MANKEIIDFTEDTSPQDTDSIVAQKLAGTTVRWTWSTIKTTIKTYLDAFYTIKDANNNITFNNWLGGYATIATAAGTTTLTVASANLEFFTGSTTQTVTMPVVSTLTLGHQFKIVNLSTGAVTVNSSGGNAILILAPGTSATFTCILITGTTAASWSYEYIGIVVTSGKKLTVSNTITIAGTDGTTMTLPTATQTLAGLTETQTFSTGIKTFLAGMFALRNVANTFSGFFTNTNTANRTYTLQDRDGTLADNTDIALKLDKSGGTMTGSIILGENTGLGLDPAGSADGKWTGLTVTAVAGYTQAFGDCVYLDPTDSRWELCDANSASGADGDSRGIVGMVVVAGTDGNACTILLNGIIRADAKFPTFTVNNPVYISETAGSVTQTQPVTTDVVIRIVGFAITADEMYFRPDNSYITHT